MNDRSPREMSGGKGGAHHQNDKSSRRDCASPETADDRVGEARPLSSLEFEVAGRGAGRQGKAQAGPVVREELGHVPSPCVVRLRAFSLAV